MKLKPLSFAILGGCLSFNAWSESLAPITVTSVTKTERALTQSPVSVEVINEATIRELNAVTLGDVLEKTGAVFMNPDQRSMSIRGVGSKGTLLLIDGRRIGTEFTKNYDAKRIPAASIERIEIVKGPMGALYGSDALGGVINIITKQAQDEWEGSVSLSSGTSHQGRGSQTQIDGDVRGKIDKTGISAWFSAQKTQEYYEKQTASTLVPRGGGQPGQAAPSQSAIRINPTTNQVQGGAGTIPIAQRLADAYQVDTTFRDPSEVLNLGLKLNHAFTDTFNLRADISWMTEKRDLRGIADSYSSNYTRTGQSNLPVANAPFQQTLDNQRLGWGVGADWQVLDSLKLDWQTSLYHYKKTDEVTALHWQALGYASQKASAQLTGDGLVDTQQHQFNATWQPHAQHRVLAGAEYFEDKRDAAFFDASGRMTTKTLSHRSLYAQHEWQISEPLALIYGLRFDDSQANDSATTFNLGTVYQFNPLANLRLRYAQGFRSPDSQELYINRFNPQGRRFVGADVVDSNIGKNAFKLKAEHSENYEIGLSGDHQAWQYDVALYHTHIKDNILRDNTAQYISFRNASEVTIKGVDMRLNWAFNSDLKADFVLNLLDSYDKDTAKRLHYTPNVRSQLGLSYRIFDDLNTRIALNYIGDQAYSETKQGQTTDKTAQAYWPLNLSVNYQPKSLQHTEFFGGIDNALNTKVDPVLGSTVGTYLYAGIRIHF